MPLFSVLARCASSISNSALALHLNILTYKLWKKVHENSMA